MVQDPSDNDAHLRVRKILANAVAGAVAEGPEGVAVVPVEPALVARMRGR